MYKDKQVRSEEPARREFFIPEFIVEEREKMGRELRVADRGKWVHLSGHNHHSVSAKKDIQKHRRQHRPGQNRRNVRDHSPPSIK